MKKNELQELHFTATLNNLITAISNSVTITTGVALEDDTEKRYAKLAKEAKAWNKVFDILQQRYSIPTLSSYNLHGNTSEYPKSCVNHSGNEKGLLSQNLGYFHIDYQRKICIFAISLTI